LNGKNEWFGIEGKLTGRIISKSGENGEEIPDIEIRHTEYISGFGLNNIVRGLKNFEKKLGSSSNKD
jgi:hypothetical protein